jgi:hypothetical protein
LDAVGGAINALSPVPGAGSAVVQGVKQISPEKERAVEPASTEKPAAVPQGCKTRCPER